MPINQREQFAGADYTLTEQERSGLQGLANQVSAAQLAVYQGNVDLEKQRAKLSAALTEVDAANARFNGALSFLLSAHGFTSGQVAPDFSRITGTAAEPGPATGVKQED
jgi:lipopolysaccharide export system protein LptA